MLNCRQGTRLLSLQQDRRLAPLQWLRLTMHLAVCEGCAAYRRQLRFLRHASRQRAAELRRVGEAGQGNAVRD